MKVISSASGIILAIALSLLATSAAAVPLYMHGWSTNTNLYGYETSTGVETLIGSTGVFNMGGIAISGSGALFGMNTSGSLYSINTSTAAASLIGSSGIRGLEGLTFGLDGATLYTSGGNSLYSVNTATGAVTNLGAIGFSDVDGLTVAPVLTNTAAGAFAAGTIFGVDSGTLFAIDPNTLVTTTIGSIAANESLTFDAAGNLFGHDFSGLMYAIDPLGLTNTVVGATSGPITGLTSARPLTGSAVPEPGSLALLGLGVLGFAARRRV